MVMHPQSCKVLAETIEYANTLKTLRLLLKALRRADGYNLPSEAEKKLVDPLEIAELKIDLRKLSSDSLRAGRRAGRRWRSTLQT